MRLVNLRDTFAPGFTLGVLTLDGRDGFYVCEDTDRGLDRAMANAELARRKVPRLTAIPATNDGPPYRLGIRYSPKHGREVLFLRDVPCYAPDCIEIHVGNRPADTDGCQVVGTQRNLAAGTVGHSTAAITWLEQELMPPVRAGLLVTYAVLRDPVAWSAFRGRAVA